MKHILPSLRMLLFMTLLTGVIYPLGMTFFSQAFFKDKALGSLVEKDGQVVGSHLVGQKFEGPKYFWGRPSAGDYNPLPSGGSNQGQASEALKKVVEERAAKLKAANGEDLKIPQDLLFASASGLDPHISPAAANYQAARVAKERGFTLDQVITLIEKQTEGRTFGLLGQPRVNVLQLNMALDRVQN